MGHSKLPWKWDGKVWDYNHEEEAPWLVDSNDDAVLSGELAISEANANLIITAVNVMPKVKRFLEKLQTGNFQNETVIMVAEMLLKELEGVDVD